MVPKSDNLTIAVGLVAVAAGFLVGGPIWGCIFLLAGIVFLVFYFQNDPEPVLTLGNVFPAAPKPASLRVYLEDFHYGIQELWPSKTFLFLSCLLTSPEKDTGIVKIIPKIFVGNEARSGEIMSDLSDWLLSPTRGGYVELQALSIRDKLNNLTKEIPQSGWLGIVIRPPIKNSQLDSISGLELQIEDGSGQVHVVPLQVSSNPGNQIVAKHVRER